MITTINRNIRSLACSFLLAVGLLGVSAAPSYAAAGAFTFSASSYSVVEGAGKINVTINRVGGSTGAVTVGFRTGLISAKAGTDYTGIPLTTQTFASGVTQKIISVGIIDDKVIEPTETFKVLLSSPTGGATLGSITSSIITIQDNDTIAVDATAPTASLTSPASGTTYTSAQTVTIAASAADNVGVSKVEFYDGASLLVTDTTAPYSFAWAITEANNGNHSFSAKAYDAAGNVTISAARSVTVNIAPLVVAKPGSFEFAAGAYTVNENGGKVDVIINRVGGSTGAVTVGFRTGLISAKAGTDYTGIRLTTQTFASGVTQKIISVGIIDDKVIEPTETFKVLLSSPTGGATLGSITSSIITIQDNDTIAVDATAPTASLTSPASGTTYTSAQTVTIAASAADNVGVSKVEFYDGASLLVTDTTAPYSFAWAITAANNGNHSLSAKAYDAAGNVASSVAATASVNIVVPVYDAPVLSYVQASGSDFLLGWSQPSSLYGAPAGGYDIVTDGVDTGTANRTMQQTAVISGLPAGEHCFEVQAQWTQAVPAVYPLSNRLCAVSTAPASDNLGPLKIFPGAEGFGTNGKAGRGGQVIKVTNLNDSGVGSLRDAISKSGPRIVVFEVGGVINLTSSIVITNPYLTIAGQSAPAPGITLTGYGLQPSTHDVLIQHLFIRVTSAYGAEDDGMRVYRGSSSAAQIYNVVIDHVSIAWANDENLSLVLSSGHDFTFSNCLLGEGHYGMLLDFNTSNVSVLRNLIMSATQRHPRIKGAVSANIVNNVLYNTGSQGFAQVGSVDGKNFVSFAGNAFIDGPSTSSGSYGVQVYDAVAGSQLYVPTSGAHRNIASKSVYSSAVVPFLTTTPPAAASLAGITVLPVENIETYIYNNVGARPAARDTAFGDSADERFISELQARVGSVKDRVKPAWSKPVSSARTFNVGANPSGDDNGNGYTNIEEILYQMALEVEGR